MLEYVLLMQGQKLMKKTCTSIDLQYRFAMTPLHYASQNGNERIVSILIEKFANVDALNM